MTTDSHHLNTDSNRKHATPTMPEPTATHPTDGDENVTSTDTDDEKTKQIMVEIPEKQFENLKDMKKRNGFTWKGVLLYAQRCVRRESSD